MNVSIFEMPLDFGASRHGSDMGPSAIRLAGIREKIESLGHTINSYMTPISINPQEYESAGNPRAKYLEPITKACQTLAGEVYHTAESGDLPVLARWPSTHMVFQRVQQKQNWEKNRFGILQPRWCEAEQRPAWALDAVFLPLVGFDQDGGRLGMGGGFYDRCFADLHQRDHLLTPQRIGLAHDFQRVEKLPLAAWDVPLSAVVTDLRKSI